MRRTTLIRRQPNVRLSVLSRRRALGALSSGAAGSVLTACGGGQLGGTLPSGDAEVGSAAVDYSTRFASFEATDEPNGDLAKVVWPAWSEQFVPEVKELYAFQIENGDLMRYMPCSCGCQREDGHRSNRDGYVEAVNADGSVVFDSMAPT